MSKCEVAKCLVELQRAIAEYLVHNPMIPDGEDLVDMILGAPCDITDASRLTRSIFVMIRMLANVARETNNVYSVESGIARSLDCAETLPLAILFSKVYASKIALIKSIGIEGLEAYITAQPADAPLIGIHYPHLRGNDASAVCALIEAHRKATAPVIIAPVIAAPTTAPTSTNPPAVI